MLELISTVCRGAKSGPGFWPRASANSCGSQLAGIQSIQVASVRFLVVRLRVKPPTTTIAPCKCVELGDVASDVKPSELVECLRTSKWRPETVHPAKVLAKNNSRSEVSRLEPANMHIRDTSLLLVARETNT